MMLRNTWRLLECLERAAPLLFCLAVGLASSCPQTRYPRYFANVTSYKIDVNKGNRTPGGVLVVGSRDTTEAFRDRVDLLVNQLDKCLQITGERPIQRKWFGVFVPPDWYVSCCTGQQLIPSRADHRLCEQKLDPQGNVITIPEICRGVVKPTVACPCPCNFRATIQDNFWIVTAPNLKLLKTELARLVTGVNAPWRDDRIKGCLY